MASSHAKHTLDSMFYESDVFSIGTHSDGHPGKSSEQQSVQITLSTKAENNYPEFIGMMPIREETQEVCCSNFKEMAYVYKDAILISDGT